MEEWQAFLDTLGYRYWDESKNPAYKLFLGQENCTPRLQYL
jgi:threonine dehydratase